MMFDCIYMELSASLDHGTNELLEAAVRTARGDCVGPGWTDGDPGAGRRESLTSRAKRFLAGLVPRSYGRDRDRDRGRYREMSRHRGSKILRQKSRSCHDLSALWRTYIHTGKEIDSHTWTHTPGWWTWGRMRWKKEEEEEGEVEYCREEQMTTCRGKTGGRRLEWAGQLECARRERGHSTDSVSSERRGSGLSEKQKQVRFAIG